MLATLDWIVITVFMVLFIGIALSYTRKAGKSMDNFFLGGRNLPWYIAGISMVATTFAADTPLAVTEIVADKGISGNWLWWSFLAGGMLTTFFFANLWRRSGVLTEVEFIELRYAGLPAAALRGFKALYLGVFMNLMIIAWVNVALITLLKVFFSLPEELAFQFCVLAMLVVSVYSSLSGFLGVAMSDVLQFITAMVGCILLAYFVVSSEEIGGLANLKQSIDPSVLEFFPRIGEESTGSMAKSFTIGFGTFMAYFTMQWWASWYPGAEPGGGGYVAQRMMSAKDERNAVYATLFFQVAHYCIRPWPWILVALSAMVLYPNFEDPKEGFVCAMVEYLPDGIKGLLLVSFLAAYMSTISTQLNWGASYVVNDFYKRFIKPEATQKNQVLVSRVVTLILMVLGLIVAKNINSISGVWSFLIEIGAGLGLVLILRWYWWRINAWSEIAATLTPLFAYPIARYVLEFEGLPDSPNTFFFTVGCTTLMWLAVTYLSPRQDEEHLKDFYLKVRPDGNWGPISALTNEAGKPSQLGKLAICWLAGITMVYAILFAIGKFLFLEYETAGLCTLLAIVAFFVLNTTLRRTRIMGDGSR